MCDLNGEKQSMENLYSRLKKLENSDIYAFHMPGHKRNRALTGADLPYGIDITEIDGFDDLHHAEGILKESQQRAAEIWHADESHYLINGSTVGIISAILGCTHRGDRILMARNCHKSVYNAVFLNGLFPVYLYPQLLSSGEKREGDINGPIMASQIERALEEYPDIKAVVITSPTYDGVTSDIHAIAECVHRKEIPLILDEAHGAHFGFHPYFLENGNDMGADIVIHSLHKTLPSLTQTALLHMNGSIADRDRVHMYLDILQSSSPSYVLMASIDECVRLLQEKREEVFCRYVDMLRETREQLKNMSHLTLWECPDYDRSKILISTAGCAEQGGEIKKYTGKRLYYDLKEKYLLQFEMCAPDYVIGMTAPGDTVNGMRRLVKALEEIDSKLAKRKINASEYAKIDNNRTIPHENEQVYLIGEINKLHKKIKRKQFAACAGCVSAEYAYIYPPGIPLIVPGERISETTVELIMKYQKTGFNIRGTHETGNIEVLDNG